MIASLSLAWSWGGRVVPWRQKSSKKFWLPSNEKDRTMQWQDNYNYKDNDDYDNYTDNNNNNNNNNNNGIDNINVSVGCNQIQRVIRWGSSEVLVRNTGWWCRGEIYCLNWYIKSIIYIYRLSRGVGVQDGLTMGMRNGHGTLIRHSLDCVPLHPSLTLTLLPSLFLLLLSV